MRIIREVLRQHYEGGLSKRQIAGACKMARSTVGEYLKRFRESGLNYPIEMSDRELEEHLFSKAYQPRSRYQKKDKVDFEYLSSEMRRPNVTMMLLWEEYRQGNPNGYAYSYFCEQYRGYIQKSSASMRQPHKGGEKVFVDFGEGTEYTDRETGERIKTRLFVWVWGASNYTYVTATRGEDIQSWISANVKALHFSGCCPKAIVPDNLKAAVSKACRYEPEINPTFLEFATYYGTAILPARPYKPKDKAKAENGVLIAKRWIVARLRNRCLGNLGEVNEAISGLLEQLNNKVMRREGKSRKACFEERDRPHALKIIKPPFEAPVWKKASVNINYHIEFDSHHYSIPYTYLHREVEVRATSALVELFLKGERIYTHKRAFRTNGYSTIKEHMPVSHQKYIEWTPELILSWASNLGPDVSALIQSVIKSRVYPEQAYKACLGIIRLEKKFGKERLNEACKRAVLYRNYSYKGIVAILTKGLDQVSETRPTPTSPKTHENVRGSEYFQTEETSEREELYARNT